MKATAEHIRQLISAGQLEDSLQAALAFLKGKDQTLYNECLLHQGRLHESERKMRVGALSMEEAERIRAMVRYSLIEEVAVKIERGLAPAVPSAPAAPKQVFQLNFTEKKPAPAAPPEPPTAGHNLEAATGVLNQLFDTLGRCNAYSAGQQLLPLLHPSLLKNGVVRPAFQQNNLRVALEKFRNYKMPVEISQWKSTNRRAVGTLGNRETGEEFVYTLAKQQDTGGMPGMVRLFFADERPGPLITVISL